MLNILHREAARGNMKV